MVLSPPHCSLTSHTPHYYHLGCRGQPSKHTKILSGIIPNQSKLCFSPPSVGHVTVNKNIISTDYLHAIPLLRGQHTRPLCPPQPRFQRRRTTGSPGDPAPSQTLVRKEAREKGRLSPPCRPAQQAWARSQQLGNRSRKGTSFLSRAGSLGQKRKGEQRRGLYAEAARNAQAHGQARPLGPKWVFHIQRGQASELGGSRNLGVGVAGRGVGLGVGLTGRKEEVVEVREVAGSPGLPWEGLKVLIRAACILDCHSPSASDPLLGQGRKPRASWEPAAFWKPRRGLSTSTQGSYLYSGVWAALLHEREETSPGGGGGPGPGVMGTDPGGRA